MTDKLDCTERGFRIYARIPERDGGIVWVQQSSLAGEGPHVRILTKGADCVDHHGSHIRPEPHLSAEQAKELIAALRQFIKETK